MRRQLPFVLIGLVFLIALGVGAYLIQSDQPEPAPAPLVTTDPAPAAEPAPAPSTPDTASAAVPGAGQTSVASVPATSPPNVSAEAEPAGRVTLEEFSDFECPHCATFYPTLQQLKREYGNRLDVRFYQFPLVQIHRRALPAAWAVEAAGLQGKFWEMHDVLFERQQEWVQETDVRPVFIGYAREIGLDVDRFTRDMFSDQVVALVREDLALGQRLGITSTPTVLINGVKMESRSLEYLRNVINGALGQNG